MIFVHQNAVSSWFFNKGYTYLLTYLLDHLPIITWLDFELNKPLTIKSSKPKMVRHSSTDANTHLKTLLTTVDWSPVQDLCNENKTNLSYITFMQLFKSAYDEAYPLKLKQPTKRNSPIQPWMTQGLLTSTRKKEK